MEKIPIPISANSNGKCNLNRSPNPSCPHPQVKETKLPGTLSVKGGVEVVRRRWAAAGPGSAPLRRADGAFENAAAERPASLAGTSSPYTLVPLSYTPFQHTLLFWPERCTRTDGLGRTADAQVYYAQLSGVKHGAVLYLWRQPEQQHCSWRWQAKGTTSKSLKAFSRQKKKLSV